MSKLTKVLFLVESGLVIWLVGVSGIAFNWYQDVHARGGGGQYLQLSVFAMQIDALFACIIAVLLIILSRFVKRPNEQASPNVWPLRLGIVFALVSFLSCLGFVIARMFPVDLYTQLFLIFLPVPGLVFGICSIVVGAIAFRKEHSRTALLGILLGIIPTVLLLLLSVNASGAPFACLNNKACNVRGLAECFSYSGEYVGYGKDTIPPGVCAFEIPGPPLINGRPQTVD